MKKLSLLLTASVLFLSGSVAAEKIQSYSLDQTQRTGQQTITKNIDKQKSLLDFKAKSQKKNYAPKASEFGDIIYEAPAGEVKTLARSGDATFAYYGALMTNSFENMISEFVICDNGDVYLKNPISNYNTDSYIKGKLDGNQIVFDLPQPIHALDYNGEDLYFLVTTMQYSDDWYYPCNTEEAAEAGLPEITDQCIINISEDGKTYSLETEDRTKIPGMIYSDNFAWTGYSERSSEWKEFSGVLNPGPAEGTDINDVVVLYNGIGHYAKVAMDGDNVFVQGIFSEQPDSWIQGKRDGNKISFLSGQYLGEDLEYNYFTYFAAATIEQAWDEYYEEWYNVYKYIKEIVFDFDVESMTMTSKENEAVAYNTSESRILYLSILDSPVIKKQPAEISPIPQNPYDLVFYDYIDSYGYSWIEFNLPMININDELLNPNDLYYIVYIDGDEMTFDSDDYEKLEDEMTLIPYSFSESYDFIANGQYHEIYFYFEGADEIGVQLCNVKDGEIIGASEIVSINTSPTGVKDVAASGSKQIESIGYFNMHGQEVRNPSEGIFVKTVKYTDGTVKSFKVTKK